MEFLNTFTMKVLGIDQSFTSCGIVLLEDGEMKFYEKFVTRKDDDIFDRAQELTVHIQLKAMQFEPDIVALEGLSFGSKGNATRDLGGLMFCRDGV